MPLGITWSITLIPRSLASPAIAHFKNSDLRPVLAEAIANHCHVILVKDQSVYWLAEQGERLHDRRQKLIAYAVGCNSDIDAFDDWWALANNELGGDDFGENFDIVDHHRVGSISDNDAASR